MKAAVTLKRYRTEWLLALLLLATVLLGNFPALVEAVYSNGIYPYIGRGFRWLFGWLPFSIGDILYGLAFLYLLYQLRAMLVGWRRGRLKKPFWKSYGRKGLRLLMIGYLFFQWAWGLNYHRLGSAYQLSIGPGAYPTTDLQRLTDTLNSRLSQLIATMQPADTLLWQNFDSLRTGSIAAYQQAGRRYPFARYRQPSVKKMLLSGIGGYGGFNGYLNPFTGEAQANAALPGFLLPYVLCHEMAHQLGYAAEEEANMIGYLACRESNNIAFRYSVYHDLLWYASREMYAIDSNEYKKTLANWPPLVRQHQKQAIAYFEGFRNPLQTVLNKWYDLYLKANSQEKGMRSYSYVTAWLIAYAQQYGWEKI